MTRTRLLTDRELDQVAGGPIDPPAPPLTLAEILEKALQPPAPIAEQVIVH